MDPVARRELWTLLRAVRMKRALLLTTCTTWTRPSAGGRVSEWRAPGKVRADGSVDFPEAGLRQGLRD